MSPEATYLYLTTIGRRRRSFRGRARVVDVRAERALVAAIRERSEAKYGWGAGLVVEIAPAARRGRAAKR